MLTSHTVAGHRITLGDGRRYRASRDPAERGRAEYDVEITDITLDGPARVAWEVTGLDYAAANALINAFNDDPRGSWLGREWR